ncbi:unnamed protein product, partial [Nesidiocoris tenuis]
PITRNMIIPESILDPRRRFPPGASNVKNAAGLGAAIILYAILPRPTDCPPRSRTGGNRPNRSVR